MKKKKKKNEDSSLFGNLGIKRRIKQLFFENSSNENLSETGKIVNLESQVHFIVN